MNDASKAIIIANIEIFVDKMIASGSIPSDHRDAAIEEYKKMARVA